MDARTLKALQGSIEKWMKIAYAGGQDKGWPNCPLCVAYTGSGDNDCGLCPVSQVGNSFCVGSPYTDWMWHHRKKHGDEFPFFCKPGCAECKRLALAELDFLKSLLSNE